MFGLPKEKVLISGRYTHHTSGKTHTFQLENAGRAKITANLSATDAQWHYYIGVEIDAGDRDGEREWKTAWVLARTAIRIRVNHTTHKIEIYTFE